MEHFNLTPTPALLDLLSKIPFKGWQCIAELLDNSIDAIINHDRKLSPAQKRISVTIPTKARLQQNEPIVIEDWGMGMTETQLENAVRAGFSSKGTKASLGLFGMGFNVATARLANTVNVWTSTADMTEEIGVTIDLKEMKSAGSFLRPKKSRAKQDNKTSGTRIELFDYKPDTQSLLKPQEIIRELTRAYSEKIFEEFAIEILVNEQNIKPFVFCSWDRLRSVKYKHEEINAILDINENFGEELFCENCYSWLGDIVDSTLKVECPNCQTTDHFIKKAIEVKGWVGVQRYSDSDHYGIDISRNGRILSRLDKSFFHWDNEAGKEDSRFHPEYPRDTTYAGGRIVGQIEANFITPNYTKADFERQDKNWKKVLYFIRGEMPLQPELASDFGFKQPNRTPIGLLFSAYRKIGTPGSKTLVFARENGSADHITPKIWAQKFYDGEPEYQTDQKWWEAVIKADLKDGGSTFNPARPLNIQRLTGPDQIKIRSAGEEKFPGKKKIIKSVVFDIEKIIDEGAITLTLLEFFPDNELSQPLIFDSTGPRKFNVYLNKSHPLFRDFADGYDDLIFMEVAAKYWQLKGDSEWTISRIYYELKSKYAQETMLSVTKLVDQANKLMRTVQNKLLSSESMILQRKPALDEIEIKSLKQKYLELEGKNLPEIGDFTQTLSFIKYLDLNFLFKFIEQFPEMIFDGKIFNLPYQEIDDLEIMNTELKKYLSYFNDVRWFINDLQQEGDDVIQRRKPLILRNRLSIEILHGSINK